jgi:hypothetical protein
MEMARKYLAFDIEIAQELPEGAQDWQAHRPLGITCAATLADDAEQPLLWYGLSDDDRPADRMDQQDAIKLVEYLETMTHAGYTVLTWNGLGFDLDILAEESGMLEACKRLAPDHVDMMFHVFCALGYPVGLDRAAKGMGLTGKTEGMSGALAPRMWAEGQHQQVLDYVAQDARTTLALAQSCEKRRQLVWTTRRGSRSRMPLPSGWLTVRQALALPQPDVSWMSDPWPRSKFTGWIE